MNFREQVAEDFKNVFLNIEEFGRICTWNGSPLQIVDGAAPPMVVSDDMIGVFQAVREIYCRQQDLPKPPKYSEVVVLDGERWVVVDVKSPFGHYIITLGRQSS